MRPQIASAYAQVDHVDRSSGMVAYQCYHDTLQILANTYSLPLERIAAAFVSLSPNNDYIGNLRSLITLLIARHRGLPVASATVSTFRACRDRAWAFLNGLPFLEHTDGPKISNFYMSIVDPAHPTAVTIDGHMVSLWHGQRMTMEQAALSRFSYEDIADDFRQAASEVGVLPSQLQGMLWFTWKRIHDVKAFTQMHLLFPSDPWRLRFSDDSIASLAPFGIHPVLQRVLPFGEHTIAPA